MSHTLTASLKQALLSLGFLIAFTGVVVVLLLAAFEDMQHFSLKEEIKMKRSTRNEKADSLFDALNRPSFIGLSENAGGVCNNSWRR